MSYKRLIPCIFIKDGKAVRWIDDPTSSLINFNNILYITVITVQMN